MVARIPNLELLLYKAQQALAHDPDFVQKIAEIKENDSRKKVYLDFSVECFSQIWGSTCTGFDVTEAGEPVMAGSAMTEEYTTIVHEKRAYRLGVSTEHLYIYALLVYNRSIRTYRRKLPCDSEYT